MVKVALRGRERVFPVLPLDVLPMLLSEASEKDVRTWVAQLSEDSPELRGRAVGSLRTAALRHEALLRKAQDEAGDPESKGRLSDLIARLSEWKEQAAAIHAHPALLPAIRTSLPPDWPEREAVVRMIDAVVERQGRK